MKEIPCFIESSIDNSVKSKIPRNIIQTYKNNTVHESIHDNTMSFLEKNRDYNYYLITDEIGVQLIVDHFDKRTLDAYNKLNLGAAKGDFLRYIAMYIYGGMYIDLDATIKSSLSTLIDPNVEHLVIVDTNFNLEQWIFGFSEKNIIVLKLIQEMVKRIHNNERNIFIATGPTLFTDVFINMINNSNYYNTYRTLNSRRRNKIIGENVKFMNGIMVFSNDEFRNHVSSLFEGYSNEYMYQNNEKYVITFHTPTPNLYK